MSMCIPSTPQISPAGSRRRHLAREKRDGVPVRGRSRFLHQELGAAGRDDLEVIVATRLRVVTPPHLVVVLPDDVLGVGEAGIAREDRVSAHVDEILVLPEYPHR